MRLWYLRAILQRLARRGGKGNRYEPLIGYAVRLISKRCRLMLLTDETLPYVGEVQCPVVVDDDDPVLTPEHVALLNHERVIQVVTTSRLLQEQLTNLGLRKPVAVIPSGVDLKGMDSQKAAAIRQSLNPADALVAGFAIPQIYTDEDVKRLGGESHLRSIEFLLEAMQQVWHQEPNLQLWLMGNPSPSAVEKCAQYPQIKLVGYVAHADILNYYVAADIGLYPRLSDFSGRHSIKLVEYMACGLPIVSTNVSEAYLVTEANAGVITSENTPQAFAGCILQFVADEPLRRGLAQNGRAFAKQYEWGHLARQYDELLLTL